MTAIRECGRTIGGGLVAFDVSWDGDLEGTVGWGVTVTADDGSEHVTLMHQRRDGVFVAQYVTASGQRHDVPEDATVEDAHLTARFPAEVVGVAAEWPVWKAVLVVDGDPVSERLIPTT